MSVEMDKAATLRAQTHGHEQIVMISGAYRETASTDAIPQNVTGGVSQRT